MKLPFILFAFVLFQISCKNQSKEQATNERLSTKNFSGTFTGVIPCADCPGIKLTVSFNPDSSFSEIMIYQERNSSFKDTGQWSRDDKMLKVDYKNEHSSPRYFLIRSDSEIVWLDANKKEIEGPLKEHYILKRK